jgi:cell division protein FtsQ
MRSAGVLAEAREKKGEGFEVAIDPRLAARRQQVRRRASMRRRVLLGLLALVSLLAASTWPLLHSRFFSARVLRVTGNTHTPSAVILSAAGLANHPPMIDVHPSAAAAALRRLPWVAGASVALHWPDGVAVTVTERVPVAYVAEGPRAAEVDATGRVLALVASAPSGLAQLVSVGNPGAPGTTLARAAPALEVLAALPAALRGLVSAAAPTSSGGVDLALSDGVGVRFGPPRELQAKFEDIASVVVGASLAAGSLLDVTVPTYPAVTPPPASGGSTGATTATTSG